LKDVQDAVRVSGQQIHLKDHLKHPDRTLEERYIALGRMRIDSLNGPLSKRAALEQVRNPPPRQLHSWRVEATTKDGRRWGNGVRLGTKEEAKVYVESYVPFDLEKAGYASAEIIRCDDEPRNSITRSRAKGRPKLIFKHGTCGTLEWVEIEEPTPLRKRRA
jgi:hypothetical protein